MTEVTGPFSTHPERVRPLLEAFIPAAMTLADDELMDVLRRSDRAMARRESSVQRQLGAALLALNVLLMLRYLRRPARISVARRRLFLEALQDAPIRLIRLAVWGVRTLCFAGYYGDTRRHDALGYHPDPRGWDALAGRGKHVEN